MAPPIKATGITSMVTRMRAAANPSSKNVPENILAAKNNKRKADTTLAPASKKRSALGDLTNVSPFSCFGLVHEMKQIILGCRLIAKFRMPRKRQLRVSRLHPLVSLADPNWQGPPQRHSPLTWSKAVKLPNQLSSSNHSSSPSSIMRRHCTFRRRTSRSSPRGLCRPTWRTLTANVERIHSKLLNMLTTFSSISNSAR